LWLAEFAISPKEQGKGFGKQALEFIEKFCKRKQIQRIIPSSKRKRKSIQNLPKTRIQKHKPILHGKRTKIKKEFKEKR